MKRKWSSRSQKPSRHRVSQEDIDAMAALRRQGLAFAEIGARQGLSERTARRYVRKVEPRLQLPQSMEPEADPHTLRERLASDLLDRVYRDKELRSWTVKWIKTGPDSARGEYGGPPSILFMNEAERLLRERLDSLGPLSLRYLAQERQSQDQFLREVIGFLYRDYVLWHQLAQNLKGEDGEDWRPRHERPPFPELTEDELAEEEGRQ